MEHQVPERRQLWHDPLTNEQWFGLVATDPDPVADAAVEELPEDPPTATSTSTPGPTPPGCTWTSSSATTCP